MTTQRPIFVVDDPKQDFGVDFVNAYKSKAGRSNKFLETAHDHRFSKPIQKVMLHQIHQPNTWLIDEVKFGEFLYVFFVEANTRYLIVVQGSTDNVTPDAFEQDGSERQISGQSFYEAYNTFVKINGKPPSHVILDSALAHTFKPFRARCVQQNVTINQVVAKDNHYALSLLDRTVKTIRTICENLHFDGTPPELVRAASIYNNTKHLKLSTSLGKPTTPNDLHNNDELEKRFIISLQRQNARIRTSRGYNLEVGTQVLVRNTTPVTNAFEKNRPQIVPGNWFITERNGNKYIVNEAQTNEQLEVMRRDIKRKYERSEF